jgi:hypothetical protein
MPEISEDHEKYDIKELQRLWELDYKSLAMDPGKTGRLREARFVMQAKIAFEARSMINSTFWLTIATGAMAVATIALAAITFFHRPA